MEIGPYRVRKGGNLEMVNGTWNEFANLLFVDNPVGTGFSYAATDSYVTELQQMADQFMMFLNKWFELFPEYMHDDVGFAQRYAVVLTLSSSISLASPTPDNTFHTLRGLFWIATRRPQPTPSGISKAYSSAMAGSRAPRNIRPISDTLTTTVFLLGALRKRRQLRPK
jgi:hypothetical protein